MRRRAERGAAVVMAMLVVAVTATLVAGVFWRQGVLVQQAENNLSYAQAKWLMRGAVDWAGVILAEDARATSADHLGEAWAVPLAETRLNEGDGREPVYLAGQIGDEQAKLNLRNLAAPGGAAAEVEARTRLCDVLGLNPGLAAGGFRTIEVPGWWAGPTVIQRIVPWPTSLRTSKPSRSR